MVPRAATRATIFLRLACDGDGRGNFWQVCTVLRELCATQQFGDRATQWSQMHTIAGDGTRRKSMGEPQVVLLGDNRG